MSAIRPISDLFTDFQNEDISNFCVDSNILIQYLDSNNKFHSKVKNTIDSLRENGLEFYYVLPTKLEMEHKWVSKIFYNGIKKLIPLCTQGNKNPLYSNFIKKFNSYDEQIISGKCDYLSDNAFKEFRKIHENIQHQDGLSKWRKICEELLTGKLEELNHHLQKITIKYAKFDDKNIYPIEEQSIWPNTLTLTNWKKLLSGAKKIGTDIDLLTYGKPFKVKLEDTSTTTVYRSTTAA